MNDFVLNRVIQRFILDHNGSPQKIGEPQFSQLRIQENREKAAREVPGLSTKQAYELAKHGSVALVEGDKFHHYELIPAEQYQSQFNQAEDTLNAVSVIKDDNGQDSSRRLP